VDRKGNGFVETGAAVLVVVGPVGCGVARIGEVVNGWVCWLGRAVNSETVRDNTRVTVVCPSVSKRPESRALSKRQFDDTLPSNHKDSYLNALEQTKNNFYSQCNG
jgi:hypothetical protein